MGGVSLKTGWPRELTRISGSTQVGGGSGYKLWNGEGTGDKTGRGSCWLMCACRQASDSLPKEWSRI